MLGVIIIIAKLSEAHTCVFGLEVPSVEVPTYSSPGNQ